MRLVVVLLAALPLVGGGLTGPESVAYMTPLETRRQTMSQVIYPVDTPDTWSALPIASTSPTSSSSLELPVFLNARPLIFERRAGHSRRHAVLNFLYSQGFAATRDLFEYHLLTSIAEMEGQVKALEEAAAASTNDSTLAEAGTTRKSQYDLYEYEQFSEFWNTTDGKFCGDAKAHSEWLSRMRAGMPIAMAVGVGQKCFVLSFSDPAVVSTLTSDGDAESYIRQEAQNFFNALGLEELDQHTPGLDALIGQMSVRARLRDEAWQAFFPDKGNGDVPNDAAPREWNWDHFGENSSAVHSKATVRRYDKLRGRLLLSKKEIPVWVLNLWRSPVRRLHMRREIEREGLQHEARLFHGVDGLSLSDMILERVLEERAVLSTGEIGCFLSHLTAWREIERQALPFGVILEDDAQLKPGFRQKLYAMLTKLESTGASWDVLFLEECREMRAHGPDLDCRAPYVDAIGNTAGILDIGGDDEGPPMCVPSGVRAYAVSHQGAKRLAEGAVPIRWAIDVYIGEMIYEQKLRAFCTVPSLARLHPGGAARSDTKSVPVFHTKLKTGEVAYTADPRAGFPSCDSILCVLHFGLSPAVLHANETETKPPQ